MPKPARRSAQPLGFMNTILASAFETIRRERVDGFREAHAHAQEVLKELGVLGIADQVLNATPKDVPCQDIADLLGMLCWNGRDEGAGIRRDAEQWLRAGSDERRLYVALHLEAFPFATSEEMGEVLTRIAESHPKLRERCLYLIAQRRSELAHET
jgi:hypothetical protein